MMLLVDRKSLQKLATKKMVIHQRSTHQTAIFEPDNQKNYYHTSVFCDIPHSSSFRQRHRLTHTHKNISPRFPRRTNEQPQAQSSRVRSLANITSIIFSRHILFPLLVVAIVTFGVGDTSAFVWLPRRRRRQQQHQQRYSLLYIPQGFVIDTSGTTNTKTTPNHIIDKNIMPRGVKKEHLPTKICVVCQRPFNWRKKWEKVWDEVTTCSKSCNHQRRALKKQQHEQQQTKSVEETSAMVDAHRSTTPTATARTVHSESGNNSEEFSSMKTEKEFKHVVLRHYKFTVAYNGARFHGFQRQAAQPKQNSGFSNGEDDDNHKRLRLGKESNQNKTKKGAPMTIQGCLEQAFLQYAQQQQQQQHANSNSNHVSLSDLRVRFAGRTDKGVHARGQVVTCFLPSQNRATTSMDEAHELQSLQSALNSRLPDDISIQTVQTVADEFDPRRDARVSKVYSYSVKFRQLENPSSSCAGQQQQRGLGIHSFRSALDDVSPLWLVPWPLYQTDKIWPALCRQLQGTHDYTPFVHKDERGQPHEPHILTVDRIEYQVQHRTVSFHPPHSHIITAGFEFHAAGFRRGMVRHLIGFLVQCARKPWPSHHNTMHSIENLWNDSDSYWKQYIESAPASGLCLESVTYDLANNPENTKETNRPKEEEEVNAKEGDQEFKTPDHNTVMVARLNNVGEGFVSEHHALSQLLRLSATGDTNTDSDKDDSTTDESSDKGEDKTLLDPRAARKAAKKAKKAARRAQREGRGDPSVGQKNCDVCGKSADLLIRCTIDASGDWKMVCGKCWHTVSGGVVDGSPNHPHYRYGGLWKNRAKT